MKKIHAWLPLNSNMILQREVFYISYNPDTGEPLAQALTKMGNSLGGDFKDGEETALVIEKESGWHDYFILEGDFRKEYERAVDKGLNACMRVYDRNKGKHRSNWSTL